MTRLTQNPERRWLARVFLAVLILAAALTGAVSAQDAAAPLRLQDCISMGLGQQPAVTATQASLGAAHAQVDSLQHLRLLGMVSREIPIRRRQANLGVSIASAGVTHAEWETTYAITRNFFSVQYARRQEAVVSSVVKQLTDARKTAKDLLDKGDPDSKITKADILNLEVNIDLYRLRQIQAAQGANRALAALREAMGVERGVKLDIATAGLPELGPDLNKDELIELALARRGEMIQAQTIAEVVALEVCAQEVITTLTARTFAAASDLHARQIPHGISNGIYRPGAIAIEMPTTLIGHRHDRVARARELSIRAGAVVDKTRQLITLEAEDAYYKWREASLKLRILSDSPKKAAEVLKLAYAKLQLGKVSGEDLLRAQTLDEQVQAQLNDTLYDHALAIAALERITAGGYTPRHRAAAPQP